MRGVGDVWGGGSGVSCHFEVGRDEGRIEAKWLVARVGIGVKEDGFGVGC